jgi:hypothetical protein
MRRASLPLIFFLFALLSVAVGQITHHNKIFLAEHETYLFFPHRHFQFVSTYTSNCSAKPSDLTHYRRAMTTVAGFDFNNSNLGISILSEEATSTVFYYAKINVNGICTVYEVD